MSRGFFPAEPAAARARVIETYGQIDHRIVKSDWLATQLAEHGYETQKILLGMNLDVFCPPLPSARRAGLLAMLRPGTAYRGADRLIDALSRVHARYPDLEIVVFGDDNVGPLPFPARNEGVVANRQRLADLYGSAAVYLDLSDHQAFGRCGLEAMACGTPPVLTREGGVVEYARHEANCLLVDPNDDEGIVSAVSRLIDDPGTSTRMGEAGVKTARRFDQSREARETLKFFQQVLAADD